MSRPWESVWTARRCADFAAWLNHQVELNALVPHARPAPDPEGRPGLLVEWSLYGRAVEVYFAWSGETTIVRRDGAPIATMPIGDKRFVLDPLRDAIGWLEKRRPECPPGQGQ